MLAASTSAQPKDTCFACCVSRQAKHVDSYRVSGRSPSRRTRRSIHSLANHVGTGRDTQMPGSLTPLSWLFGAPLNRGGAILRQPTAATPRPRTARRSAQHEKRPAAGQGEAGPDRRIPAPTGAAASAFGCIARGFDLSCVRSSDFTSGEPRPGRYQRRRALTLSSPEPARVSADRLGTRLDTPRPGPATRTMAPSTGECKPDLGSCSARCLESQRPSWEAGRHGSNETKRRWALHR